MTASLAGRTAVITGAAGGLGRTITAALVAGGARLLLVDIDAAGLAQLRGERCEVLVADIADPDGRQAIVTRCRELQPAPDILINNAGVERASEYGRLGPDEIRHELEVNLIGAMLLTHALLADMRRRGRGHVINVSSLAGVKPVPYNTVYNTAKAALLAFSMSLSKELDGTGVAATAICPSAVTGVGMWARVSSQLATNRLVESSTVGPEAVAEAVLRAIARRPRRILVGSALVRAGALLSALSPRIDRLTDRISRIDAVYRERIRTDRDNVL